MDSRGDYCCLRIRGVPHAAGLALCFLFVGAANSQESVLERQFRDQYNAGRYAEALKAGRQLLDLAERTPSNRGAIAVRCQNLGNVYHGLGQHTEAERLLRRAINLREGMGERDTLALADSLNSLGIVKKDQDDFLEAELLLKRSLAIVERRASNDRARVSAAINNLAVVYLEWGRWGDAEPLLVRALELKQQAKPPNELEIAMGLNNLASLYSNQNRPADCERLYREALNIRQRLLPADHPDVATSFNNLGAALVEQGRDADAEPFLEKAVAQRRKILPSTHVDLASSLNNLGIVYSNQGRRSDAEKYYREALLIRQEALGGEHADVRASLNNLAILYKEMGRFAEAEKLYKRIIAAAESGNAAPQRLATYYLNLANLREAQGSFEEAAKAAERASELAHQGGVSGADLERYVRTRGSILANQKRYAEAAPVLKEAVELGERHAASPQQLARGYYLLAHALDSQGDRAGAMTALVKSLDLGEQHRLLSAADPAGRAQAFESSRAAFELMATFAAEAKDYDGLLRTLERMRGQSFREQVEAQTNRGGKSLARNADRIHAAAALADLEKQLASVHDSSTLKPADRSRRITELEEKISDARSELARRYRQNGSLSPKSIPAAKQIEELTIERLQTWLKPRGGIILYYFQAANSVHLLAVPHDAPPTWQQLEISDAVAARAGCEKGPVTRPALNQLLAVNERPLVHRLATGDDDQKCRDRLADLFSLLMPGKLGEQLTGGAFRHLVVVHEGHLSSIPIEALVVQREDDPVYFLDCGPSVSYCPNVAWLIAPTPVIAPKDYFVVSIGDPQYAENDPTIAARFGQSRSGLMRLPFSGLESSWVADSFRKSSARVQQLSGAAATEAAMKPLLPKAQILHLACHGMVDQLDDNLFGALAVAKGNSSNDPDDDGMLTLAEIYGLDLSECDLAILSACRTNLGPEQQGEGTWALSRGFMVAGARRVIGTNWLVDDEASATLVNYVAAEIANRRSEGQLDYAAALQKSKRLIRRQEQWSKPYFWASFVLLGPD